MKEPRGCHGYGRDDMWINSKASLTMTRSLAVIPSTIHSSFVVEQLPGIRRKDGRPWEKRLVRVITISRQIINPFLILCESGTSRSLQMPESRGPDWQDVDNMLAFGQSLLITAKLHNQKESYLLFLRGRCL